jgi:hypothetical protein
MNKKIISSFFIVAFTSLTLQAGGAENATLKNLENMLDTINKKKLERIKKAEKIRANNVARGSSKGNESDPHAKQYKKIEDKIKLWEISEESTSALVKVILSSMPPKKVFKEMLLLENYYYKNGHYYIEVNKKKFDMKINNALEALEENKKRAGLIAKTKAIKKFKSPEKAREELEKISRMLSVVRIKNSTTHSAVDNTTIKLAIKKNSESEYTKGIVLYKEKNSDLLVVEIK